jgi:hypothetical protein
VTLRGLRESRGAVQVGHVEEGVRYADELPQLHAEVKRDVHWIGAIHAQADLVCKRAVHLSAVVKASEGCVFCANSISHRLAFTAASTVALALICS